MKIAVFHELPPGGARRAINEFSRSLKKRNKVDLYIVDEFENKPEVNFYSKINFIKFMPEPWTGNNWRMRIYKDTIELVKLYFLHRKIAKRIDSKGYDVVLVSASKFIEAPFIMRFLKTPFVFYIHDPNYRLIYDNLVDIDKKLDFFRYNYERINRLIRKFLDKKNVSCAKVCLSPSNYIAGIFSKTYGKKNTVVRYGVDYNFFKPLNIEKKYDLLYIGSSHPYDAYNFLKKSLAHINQKLIVKELLSDKEWISDDRKIRELYQTSRLMVCPAKKEGLGLTVGEAMACGLPVIAINEAGHKETVINNETGYLVPRDSKKFAAAITSLLKDENKQSEFSKNARNFVLKYWSWDKQAVKLENILSSFSK